MLETERDAVILGLQKIAETQSDNWRTYNVCLKAARMLNAVVDGRIENKKGHWIESPEFWDLTCSECGKTWGTCDNDTQDFCFCPSCGAEMMNAEAEQEKTRTQENTGDVNTGDGNTGCGNKHIREPGTAGEMK